MNRLFSTFASVFVFSLLLAACVHSGTEEVSGSAVIREMNLARQNPALYASYVQEVRLRKATSEGLSAVDEAVRFLRSTQPLPPLTLSQGMCRGAADHCAEQAGGSTGHGGFGNNPGRRISRYGTWTSSWGENIAYGKMTARDIVVALIIDDGVRSRGHRKNIFNPNFNYAGAAYGPHARYRSVCTTDFAGGFVERGQVVAQN